MDKIQKEREIRKIIHVDMDAFFAAVEIRDNPQYKGKPIIVGGKPNSRGVVATCSYEARKFGIHSAMPSFMAYKLCPQAIFVRGRFDAYREASKLIEEIFFEYSDLVEPVSIDEAYLDVTNNKKCIASATQIAIEIRSKIFNKTKLTASAGVSYNKFLAKIASDMNKPDGLVVVTPLKAKQVLEELPIGKFHGIGKASEKKMKMLGINNGKDLKERTLKELVQHFGKVGKYYYNIVRGIDNREIVTERIRKSLGHERTFSKDVTNIDTMVKIISELGEKISKQMQERHFKAKTLTLKIKYANFDVVSRSKTIDIPFDKVDVINHLGRKMLLENLGPKCKIRLLGMSVSNLVWQNDDQDKQEILSFYEGQIPII
ncbi:MAG: DNA polymerase IV [Candidatus Cloacimonetes bacterium]|nr:DNA polymerase IV [Candidatus Cloacimonadota bacterium]